MSEERVRLTRAQVDEQLADGDMVHTFINGGGYTVFGCDRERSTLLDMAEQYGAELAGKEAVALGHGIAIWDEDGHPVFCKTKKKEDRS